MYAFVRLKPVSDCVSSVQHRAEFQRDRLLNSLQLVLDVFDSNVTAVLRLQQAWDPGEGGRQWGLLNTASPGTISYIGGHTCSPSICASDSCAKQHTTLGSDHNGELFYHVFLVTCKVMRSMVMLWQASGTGSSIIRHGACKIII